MRKWITILLPVVLSALVASGCRSGRSAAPPTEPAPAAAAKQAASFTLTSTVFAQGESIPVRYTCDGEDISPPLQWDDLPEGTQSLALIMDDPDAPAGTWVHWVLYNIPADKRALSEGIPADRELPDGSRHGQNSWGRPGYGGPCPPSGTHRYFFKMYALDTMLDLDPGASKEALLKVMEGHVLAQAELMGTYQRR